MVTLPQELSSTKLCAQARQCCNNKGITKMAHIVLVPGAFHGSWYFAPLMPALRAAGHDVHAISLTGLEGPAERPRVSITLDTHIEDVVSLIELHQMHDVVLFGHSYAGMVIAGAADRLPGRIRTLAFIDALVPNSGDSVWSTFPPALRDGFIGASPDGILTPANGASDPRARGHPLATFLQPITLSDTAYHGVNKVYALCAADAGSPFQTICDRLSADPDWIIRKLATGHDFMNQAPEMGRDLILEVAAL